MKKYAYGALLYSENYLSGIIGLQTSLKYVQAKYPLFILVEDTLPNYVFDFLRNQNIPFKKIKTIIQNNKVERYNKIINYFQYWECTEYDRICAIDLDIILTKNIDDFFEKDPEADFIIQHFYEDEEIDKIRFYTGINIITPKKGYWNYILNKYNNSNLDEEEILFLEQYDSLKITKVDKEFLGQYYHDTRAKKYWERENLTNVLEIKEYALKIIYYLTNKISAKKAYTCICYNEKYLPSILLLNYQLKLVKSNYPFVVLLVENNQWIQSILEREKIYYLIIPSLKNSFLNLFHNLYLFEKIVYLDSRLYIKKNIDFLFNYPDGSAFYSQLLKAPDFKSYPNDILLVFEPKNHCESYYNISYKNTFAPSRPESSPIAHLWFHVQSNKDYQITDEIIDWYNQKNSEKYLVIRRNLFESLDEISNILKQYFVL